MKFRTNNNLLALAKELRVNQTEAEQKLWDYLKSKRLHGYKFRRQEPIGKYIVDFICLEKNLIIELDGEGHKANDQKEYDKTRSDYLSSVNLKVIRFWNNEILNDIDKVLKQILIELESTKRYFSKLE